MRVLIATGLYPPDTGGPATYSKELYDSLPRQGVSVSVLSFGEVRGLPKIIRHLVYFLKVLNKGKSVDIIYAQDPVSVGLPSILAAKILRKKFILKVVGDYAWEQFQQSVASNQQQVTSIEKFQTEKFGWVTELRRKIQRLVAKNADKIIVPSKYLKKIVSTWLSDGQVNKIEVIYNAFEAPAILEIHPAERGKDEIRKDLDLHGKVIVSIGRLVPWKGFKMLIDIMPEILKEIPDAKLYIIGEGPDQEALKLQVASYKLHGKVSLLGRLTREKLLRYLKASDLFVLNTGYEGMSHQILEAMAVGTPILTTDVGGNPEIIESGKDGILIEYNNKKELKRNIINLLKNKELIQALSQNARKKVKNFSKEKMIKETIEVLSGAIQITYTF